MEINLRGKMETLCMKDFFMGIVVAAIEHQTVGHIYKIILLVLAYMALYGYEKTREISFPFLCVRIIIVLFGAAFGLRAMKALF
jgi:hypothetical protein